MKLDFGYVGSNGHISLEVDVECVMEIRKIFEHKVLGYVGSKRYEEAAEALEAMKKLSELMEEAKEKDQEQEAADDYDIVNDPTLPF